MRKLAFGQPRDHSAEERLSFCENALREVERASQVDDGRLERVVRTSKTYDPPNLVAGASTTTTVTATGAQGGDGVVVSFSLPLQGLILSGEVTNDNEVTATLYNPTAGAVDLASGTLKVWVTR